MSFKNFFGGATLGKQATPKSAPQSLVHAATLPDRTHKRALAMLGLRRGMWVVFAEERIAIVTEFLPNGVNEIEEPLVRIHFVDELGITIGGGDVSPKDLRQAAWKDIPEVRRPEKQAAADAGYRT